MKEEWKYIEGTDKVYISNLGNLKINDELITSFPLKHGKPFRSIKINGKHKTCFIHLLVLKYFHVEVPLKQPGHLVINYRDGNILNVSVDNLYYTYNNRAIKKTQEEFNNEVQTKFKHLAVIGKYVDSYTKLDLKCNIHNKVFPITPVSLSNCKYGCPDCNVENRSSNIAYTREEFIAKSIEKFGDTFDYTAFDYKGCIVNTVFTCKAYGHRYKQKPYVHLGASTGCKVCNNAGSSEGEKILSELCKTFDKNTLHRYKPSWLLGKELDIYVPSKNLAIEYNGYKSHHSSPEHVDTYMAKRAKDKTYHLNKYTLCKLNDIDLVHIFDFEDLPLWSEKLIKVLSSNVGYQVTYENNERVINDYLVYGQSDIILK